MKNVNETDIVSFIARCQLLVDTLYVGRFSPSSLLSFEYGRKYVRVISTIRGRNKDGEPVMTDQRSVWAFICMETGNILKPANWKTPAKGVRGNLFDTSLGMDAVSAYGVNYL